ncbi:MAG: hypothetical protein GY928_39410 [Colwellia sp.]|nr:hypothetical protein [Colwellia sp.]
MLIIKTITAIKFILLSIKPCLGALGLGSIEGSDNGKLTEKIFSSENFFKFSTFFLNFRIINFRIF